MESICKEWEFKQIIPAHFDAPIAANPADLRYALPFATFSRSRSSLSRLPFSCVRNLLVPLSRSFQEDVRVRGFVVTSLHVGDFACRLSIRMPHNE